MKIMKCEICGKVFQSIGQSICADCSNKVDEDYIAIRDYIHDNPTASYGTIVDELGINHKSLRYLIKEKRIGLQSAEGSGIRCVSCGAEILGGKLCEECTEKLRRNIGGTAKKEDEAEAGGSSLKRDKSGKSIKPMLVNERRGKD